MVAWSVLDHRAEEHPCCCSWSRLCAGFSLPCYSGKSPGLIPRDGTEPRLVRGLPPALHGGMPCAGGVLTALFPLGWDGAQQNWTWCAVCSCWASSQLVASTLGRVSFLSCAVSQQVNVDSLLLFSQQNQFKALLPQ